MTSTQYKQQQKYIYAGVIMIKTTFYFGFAVIEFSQTDNSYLWKRGKKKNVFKIRKFVLNKNLKLLTYFIKEGVCDGVVCE